MTQESFRESSVKELRRLEDQLAGLQQELAALALKQSLVADEVGLLPQQIQAVRDDVSGNHQGPAGPSPPPLRPHVLGPAKQAPLAPAASVMPKRLWRWPWHMWALIDRHSSCFSVSAHGECL